MPNSIRHFERSDSKERNLLGCGGVASLVAMIVFTAASQQISPYGRNDGLDCDGWMMALMGGVVMAFMMMD